MNNSSNESLSFPQYDNDNNNNNTNHNQLDTRFSNYRSLDEYLEEAYQSTTTLRQWKYWCIILSCGVAISSDASEILALSYILDDETFSSQILDSNPSSLSSISNRQGPLAASIFIGMLLGATLLSTLGETHGRRPIILSGLFLNAIAGTTSAASPNIWIFGLLRFLAGVGIGASIPPTFTLVTELAPPTRRGFFITVCAGVGWMMGSVYVAVVALGVLEWFSLGWRVFVLVCGGWSVMGFGICWGMVPESPRFLAMCCRDEGGGRVMEALDVANWLAGRMGYTDSLLTEEEMENSFPNNHQQSTMSRLSHSQHDKDDDDDDDDNDDDNVSAVNTHIHLGTSCKTWIHKKTNDFCNSAGQLYNPQLRRTTYPLQVIWFSLSFGSYGLIVWINALFLQLQLQNVYANALLFAASSLPGAVLSAIYMDQFPRTKLLTLTIAASAVSLLTFATSVLASYPPGIIGSACAFQSCSFAAWNTLDCVTSELFPTTVRSTGVGVCSASGRVGAIVAQLVNGGLINRPVRLLVVAAFALGVGGAAPYFLPRGMDLSGRPVLDTVSTADDDDVDVDVDDDGCCTVISIESILETNMYTPLNHSEYFNR